MYGTVAYLEGPYLTRQTGEIDASVDVVGTPNMVVVNTDGASHFIPVRLVVKVEPIYGPIPGCAECDYIGGGMGPRHNASANCESGRRNHCSCDVCF